MRERYRRFCASGIDGYFFHAIGRDLKGKSPPMLYRLGIAARFWNSWVAGGIYMAVALM